MEYGFVGFVGFVGRIAGRIVFYFVFLLIGK